MKAIQEIKKLFSSVRLPQFMRKKRRVYLRACSAEPALQLPAAGPHALPPLHLPVHLSPCPLPRPPLSTICRLASMWKHLAANTTSARCPATHPNPQLTSPPSHPPTIRAGRVRDCKYLWTPIKTVTAMIPNSEKINCNQMRSYYSSQLSTSVKRVRDRRTAPRKTSRFTVSVHKWRPLWFCINKGGVPPQAA